MHMLHVWRGDEFLPVTESATISEVRNTVPWARQESITHQLGLWNRSFAQAQELVTLPVGDSDVDQQVTGCRDRLLRMAVSRDEPVLDLAETFLMIPDLLNYWFTGEKRNEFSDATTTQFFNPQTRTWATSSPQTDTVK